MESFVREDLPLHALWSTTVAAFGLLAPSFAGSCCCGAAVFDFLNEKFAREEAIHTLLTGFLTLDLNPGGTVEQHHAGGIFVHVLAAVAAGPDELFLEIQLPHTEFVEAAIQFRFLVRRDRVRAHSAQSRSWDRWMQIGLSGFLTSFGIG